MNTIRTGIIGIGGMGSSHVERLLNGEIEGLTLTAVADTQQARRDWARERAGADLAIFDEGMPLIESGLVDAVIIATPHYLHPVFSKAALDKGLHALTEKPAGVFTKAVREVNGIAAQSDKTYAIMLNQRTNCVYRKLKEMVDSGEMGQLRRVNWIITNWYRTQSYYDSGSWRATWDGEGGGVLINQCPHNLDLLQWICGMPVRVRAFAHNGKWHDIEVEDDVSAYMEFANGATGIFVTSTGDSPGTNRLELTLDCGKLICEGDTIKRYQLSIPEPMFRVGAKAGFAKQEVTESVVETDGQHTMHNGVLQAFADHLLHGAALVADGSEGINALMLSNAIHLSSWTGETVDLPIDEERFLALLNERRAHSRKKEGQDVVMDTAGSYGV